jgi:hypothetical protein
MTSILSDNLKEDFYIKLYFDTSKGFNEAGIKRAFLDFSRTLVIKDVNRITLKQTAERFILTELKKVTEIEFDSQLDFDNFHKKSCENLINTWSELTYGQAQKWLNMTLKYWLLFGDGRVKGIEKNARYFHIPIDSYVQKGMFNEKYPKAWSKIDNYETYFNYQERHRSKNTENSPIIDEFNFFNLYKAN